MFKQPRVNTVEQLFHVTKGVHICAHVQYPDLLVYISYDYFFSYVKLLHHYFTTTTTVITITILLVRSLMKLPWSVLGFDIIIFRNVAVSTTL